MQLSFRLDTGVPKLNDGVMVLQQTSIGGGLNDGKRIVSAASGIRLDMGCYHFVKELGQPIKLPVQLYTDNQDAIASIKNEASSSKTNHVHIMLMHKFIGNCIDTTLSCLCDYRKYGRRLCLDRHLSVCNPSMALMLLPTTKAIYLVLDRTV
jgi:hypothetical protein